MIDREYEDGSGAIRRGWAPAHSWRWFLIRSAKHVPKAARDQPQWKSLGAQFFAILQALGQAANEDGTNAFLGIDTLMAVGRCSKDTVHKVLIAAEAVQLIRKTANARGGRNPKPATYACTFPLGADTETGRGLDWERALLVLSSSEHDRRLRHKRTIATGRHMTPSEGGPPEGQEASRDAPCEGAGEIQKASRDEFTGRHVTDQRASCDAPTRFHQDLHHENAGVVDPPRVDAAAPADQDPRRPDPGLPRSPALAKADRRHTAGLAAANYQRHVATCDRCPREIWCPEGSRLRRYLATEQHHKRARYLGGNDAS
ncbi:hypothetical protein [Streptomyces sp. NBC_01443]|uniref:hypothetical protein n=1 Tax=Streptomyces sp. NBC_01443 TaxID=2903868 RepID=UPI00225B82F7|nr:hypothetical protein [Streptomyces sp. NBC_01443]MCX4632834.1 hypothetical protein [Streptomyces sp. NBC_01443]